MDSWRINNWVVRSGGTIIAAIGFLVAFTVCVFYILNSIKYQADKASIFDIEQGAWEKETEIKPKTMIFDNTGPNNVLIFDNDDQLYLESSETYNIDYQGFELRVTPDNQIEFIAPDGTITTISIEQE